MNTRRCASEDVEPWRGWTPVGVPARTLGPKGGGVDCEIPHRMERGTSTNEDVGPLSGVDCEIPHRRERERIILYKGVKTSP